jgi:MFS family permease
LVLSATATQAGLTITVFSIIGIFLSPILGRQIAKSGNARLVLVIGTVVRIVIAAAFIFVLVPGTPLWLIYALMFVAGIYNCQQGVTYAAGPQIQLKEELRVQGNAVIQVAQSLGAGVGMAVYTLIMVSGNFQLAFIVSFVTAVATLIAGLFLKKLDANEGAKLDAN